MSIILGFLLRDETEKDQAGVVLTTEDDNLNFEGLKQMLLSVINHPDLRDRFDLPSASDELTHDIIAIEGVAIGRFTFHNVTRRDWARDSATVLAKQNPDCKVICLDPTALALVANNSARGLSFSDIAGPWHGVLNLHSF